MKKFKWICSIVIALFALFQFLAISKVNAENNSGKINNDILLVIDSSKSMTTSDPSNIRIQAIKEFMQLCHQGDKAGLVAFSDAILKEIPLRDLNSQSDIQGVSDAISGVELGKWTDIGLALNRAAILMEAGRGNMHDPIIILLSDGKNDPSREKLISENDIISSVNTAKDKNFKIYTIGLNADGSVDENLLKNISSQTNGKYFPTTSASELKNIIFEIFAASKGSTINQNQKFEITGDTQNIKFNIPEKNVLEANIVIQSQNGIKVSSILDPQGKEQLSTPKAICTEVNADCVLKLLRPVKGEWNVALAGTKGDIGQFNLIFDYDIAVNLKVSPEKAHKGDSIKVESFLSINNNKYINKELFQTINGTMLLKDITSGSTKEAPLTKKEDSFTGEFTLDTASDFEVKVRFEGDNFFRESEPVVFKADNRAPVVGAALKNMEVSKGAKNSFVDLKGAFSDPDGDTLSYKVESSDTKILGAAADVDKIKLSPSKKGKSTIVVTASDNSGGTASQTFDVEVTSKMGIITIVLLALIAIAIIVIIIKLLPKPILPLFGEITVQIRDEASNTTYSPETIQLPNVKKVTLFQVMRMDPEFQETDKIYITSGKMGNSLIITNKSGCLIEEYSTGVSESKVVEVLKDGKVTITVPSAHKSILIEYYY